MEKYEKRNNELNQLADSVIQLLSNNGLTFRDGREVLEKALSKLERAASKNKI